MIISEGQVGLKPDIRISQHIFLRLSHPDPIQLKLTQSASSNVAPYSQRLSYRFRSFFLWTLRRYTCNRFFRTLADTCRCSDRANFCRVSTKEYVLWCKFLRAWVLQPLMNWPLNYKSEELKQQGALSETTAMPKENSHLKVNICAIATIWRLILFQTCMTQFRGGDWY
mgnify:CR=1 FL=1